LHARDRLLLARIRRTGFDPRNLVAINDVDVAAIFADQSIADGWRIAHAAAHHIYGDEDRFNAVNPGDRRALYHLVRALKPTRILDVGTHVGASALHMALALKAEPSCGTVTTIDICDVNKPDAYWRQADLPASPRDVASELGCNVRFVVGSSLSFLQGTSETFDFVVLDGEHSWQNVYREIAAILPLLTSGGIIVLHDYFPELKPLYPAGPIIDGPFLAMSRIMKECPAITVLPLGSLPWPTKQGINVTSLAIVART
jgi:predicted O-methyltransferase YrrM